MDSIRTLIPYRMIVKTISGCAGLDQRFFRLGGAFRTSNPISRILHPDSTPASYPEETDAKVYS